MFSSARATSQPRRSPAKPSPRHPSDNPGTGAAVRRHGIPEWAWLFYLLGGALVSLGYLGVRPLAAQGLLFAAVQSSAVWAILAGARRNRLSYRPPWELLACGQALVVVGDSIVYAHWAGAWSAPRMLDDLCYLISYPLFALALLLVIRRRTQANDRGTLLDALMIAVGIGMLGWQWLVAPGISQGAGLLDSLMEVAFPLIDLMLLAIFCRFFLAADTRSPACVLLTLGLVSNVFLDSWLVLLRRQGAYTIGRPMDLGWLFADLFIGAALLHPSVSQLFEPSPADPSPRPGRLVMVGAGLLVPPAILVSEGLRSGPLVFFVAAAGTATLSLLALARMWGLVAQVQRQARRLDELARTDGLTGMPNRRVWEIELPRELARAAREAKPVCVALTDLDHFKAYNDQHGHPTGDRLLREAVTAWSTQLRESDVLARYGGEEFAIVLPDCALEEAAVIVDRLRAATPEAQTCSAGIVLWDGAEPAEQLVRRADAALYRAKAEGRNRTVVAAECDLRLEAARDPSLRP
ncbi:MAG: GGDEF domain-containing protein [Actinomycetota bacterium]|nr:GGDEF domain-containing protein [Actinomycetota bacterium]